MLLVAISGLVMRLLWRVYNTCGLRGVRSQNGNGRHRKGRRMGDGGTATSCPPLGPTNAWCNVFIANTQMSLILCVRFEPGVKDQYSNSPTCPPHDLASGSRFDRRGKQQIHLNCIQDSHSYLGEVANGDWGILQRDKPQRWTQTGDRVEWLLG
jgi:hypothetical protein